jgi:hypothetical protein
MEQRKPWIVPGSLGILRTKHTYVRYSGNPIQDIIHPTTPFAAVILVVIII